MVKDKRRIKRRFLQYFNRIYDASTRKQIGNLVDVTPMGVMITSEHPLPVGLTTRLRLELTDEVAEKPYMEFSACSKWCNTDFVPAMHISGFEILDLAPEDAEIINRIIAEFGFRDNIPVT